MAKRYATANTVRTRPLMVRHEPRSLDDVLEQMATKWALRAERAQQTKTLARNKK